MKRLFNASFEESKYLIYKRNYILLPGGDSEAKRIGESLLSGAAFWPTIVIMVMFPVFTYLTYPQKIRVLMVILEVIMLGWVLFMADIYPKFNHKNWAEMHKKMVPSMIGFYVSIFIPFFPFMKDETVKISEAISVFFQILLAFSCFVTCIYYFLYLPLRKIKENKLGIKEKDSKLRKLLVIDLVFIVLSFITGTVHYFSAARKEEFVECCLLTFLVLATLIGGFIFFKIYLSYHYIAKYPEQYRLYYKIPDSIWYFSKEEAEKRNDPVYPPQNK